MKNRKIEFIPSRRSNPFTLIDKEFIEDPQLSPTSKWIVTYLAGKPSGWIPQIRDIVNHSTVGESAIYSGMRQLRKFGYAKLIDVRKNGKITERRWVVSPSLLGNLLDSDFLKLENLIRGNRPLNKKEGNTFFCSKKNYPPRSCAATSGSFHLNGYSQHLSEIETKFSPVVVQFAQFSKEKGYHIRGKNLKRVIYTKGGCAGGWNRQTLSTWQACYRGLLHQVKDKNKIKEVLQWFIANHEVDEWCPECCTFTTFCERFGRIEKAMRRSQAKFKRQMNMEEDNEPHSHIIHYVIGKDGKRRLVQDNED